MSVSISPKIEGFPVCSSSDLIPVAVPTKDHMQYQITEHLPWMFKHYVLRDRHAKLKKLYRFREHYGMDTRSSVE